MSKYDELKKLAAAATPGPWVAETEGGRLNVASEDWYLLEMHHDQPKYEADAAFIASANPTAILELIAENEQLRAQHARHIEVYRDQAVELIELRAKLDLLREVANG